MAKIRHPFGAVESSELSAAGAQAITIDSDVTIIDGVTVQATSNRTIDLTIDSEVGAGAKVFVKTKTAASQTTAFGTGMTAPTLTGVAGKTFTQSFTYDGSAFLPDGTGVQID